MTTLAPGAPVRRRAAGIGRTAGAALAHLGGAREVKAVAGTAVAVLAAFITSGHALAAPEATTGVPVVVAVLAMVAALADPPLAAALLLVPPQAVSRLLRRRIIPGE